MYAIGPVGPVRPKNGSAILYVVRRMTVVAVRVCRLEVFVWHATRAGAVKSNGWRFERAGLKVKTTVVFGV